MSRWDNRTHTNVPSEGAEHLPDYMVEAERSATSVMMQAHGMSGY
jgi:hypothetical protein